MLTSIVFSIIVLPGIVFLVFCLFGFHRALVSGRHIQVQVERLGTETAAEDSQPMRTSSSPGRAA